MIVYGVKGDGLQESAENWLKTRLKIGIFRLKVIVYGEKGDNYIDKCITYMLDYRKISQGDDHNALKGVGLRD